MCNEDDVQFEPKGSISCSAIPLIIIADKKSALDGGGFSPSVGLGFVGGMCNPAYSAAIAEASSASLAYVAAVVAHETGHTLGMDHDADGADPRNLMSPASPADPAGANLQFSPASRRAAAAYFESTYGVGLTPACLDDAPGGGDDAAPWDVPVCGDGIVDDGEDCDVGFGFEDPCCSAACALADGCDCAAASSEQDTFAPVSLLQCLYGQLH